MSPEATAARPRKPKQPSLDLGDGPSYRFRKIELADIRIKDFGSPPSSELVRSVGISGVLIPVLVRESKGGKYDVRDGRRRVLAAKENGLLAVPAMLMVGGNPDLHDPAVTLEANDTSSPNPIIELEAIEELMRQVPGIGVPQIARGLGIKRKTVKDRLKLTSLRYELRDAWKAGKFIAKVGVDAAKLDETQQAELFHRYEASGTLTLDDVKAVKRTNVRSHQRTLPNERKYERATETLAKVKSDLIGDLGEEHDVIQAIESAIEALASVEE